MDSDSIAALRETIAGSETSAQDDEFERVWPDNVATVEAFLCVSTQWRIVACNAGGAIGPAGGVIGPTVPIYIALDYTAVRAGLDAENVRITPELWRGLRVMESAAAAALNEAD